MVKSAQDVARDDAAAALNGSAMWGIFLQAEMGPCLKCDWPDRRRRPATQYVELIAENNHLCFESPARHNAIAQCLCVPKIRFGVDARNGRGKLAA